METTNMVEVLQQAKQSIDHSKLIVQDMDNNKGNYSAADLAWRCISLSKVVIDSMGSVVDAFLAVAEEYEAGESIPPVCKATIPPPLFALPNVTYEGAETLDDDVKNEDDDEDDDDLEFDIDDVDDEGPQKLGGK